MLSHRPFSRWLPATETHQQSMSYQSDAPSSMGDLFHPDVPDAYLRQVFAVMAATPRHTYQVLTKRPGRMRDFLRREAPPGSALGEHLMGPRARIWCGTSVEDQAAAGERIPLLLGVPARVRFLSCEPLLGPLDLGPWLGADKVNWVIAGGESGRRARAMEVDWARGLRDDCVRAGVAYFFKQHGGRTAKAGGRVLDGRTWDEMPEMLEMSGMADMPV